MASTDVRAAWRFVMLGAGLAAAGAAFAAEPAGATVRMEKQTFVPATITVAAGTTVTWTNSDDIPHSVTADDQRFDSGTLAPGQTFRWTADQPGEIHYHCIFHPSMTAVVNVSTKSSNKAAD
jgi:plastocyanin